jgi:rubrerythrin
MSTTDALQAALAAEHAAGFVLGTLAARTSREAQPALAERLADSYRTHLRRRDEFTGELHRLGVKPVAAEPLYAVPGDLQSPAPIRRRALRLERDCAATYAHLVASSTDELRELAITALIDAAQRELHFGGEPRTLPGL